MDRRDVLTGLAAAGACAALGVPTVRAAATGRFLGSRVNGDGNAFATAFDAAGRVSIDVALPARGHGMAVRPDSGEVVVMARRPGSFGVVLDAAGGHRGTFHTAAGRWFNGHGVFAGPSTLLASETVLGSGDGVIGVYAAADGYRRIGEFPSGGLEPHDVALLGDGRTLVIANGGLRRDPDRPRIKTNIATMTPNLAYLDATTGRLLEIVEPPPAWHKLGTRHLATAPDGTVAVAMQYDGAAADTVPLVALHSRGASELTFLHLPTAAQRGMRHYAGDIAFDATGRMLGVTSPPGSRAVFWDRDDGFVAAARVADVCGISGYGDGGFVLSSGLGGVVRWLPDLAATAPVAGPAARMRWDNHLIGLGNA